MMMLSDYFVRLERENYPQPGDMLWMVSACWWWCCGWWWWWWWCCCWWWGCCRCPCPAALLLTAPLSQMVLVGWALILASTLVLGGAPFHGGGTSPTLRWQLLL